MTPLQWFTALVIAWFVAIWTLCVPIRLMPAPRDTTGTRALIIMPLTLILPIPILILCAPISVLPLLITNTSGHRLSQDELLGVAGIAFAGVLVVGLIEVGIRLYAALSHRDVRAEREQAQARTARKVAAIRRYREEHDVGLWEAKQAVDAMEQGGSLN